MSLLAHIVTRTSRPEPAATLALEYLLNKPHALAAFVQLLGSTGVSFEPGRAESERQHGEGQPDLTIYDASNQPRVFVENKFWAGLTPAQPVGYVKELLEDVPSALLFVVPGQRLPSVWGELKARCLGAGVAFENEVVGGPIVWARLSANRVLAAASWGRVLDALASVDEETRQEVRQLRGLAERMDAEAFLPLLPEELTSIDLPRRLINYSDLIEPIVGELQNRGVADVQGLRPTHGYHTAGRYLRVHGRFGLWFGVEMRAWRDTGKTPLWWVVDNTEFGRSEVWLALEGLFDEVEVYDQRKCIPIRLLTGVEREAVMMDAADRMQKIADRLDARFPE